MIISNTEKNRILPGEYKDNLRKYMGLYAITDRAWTEKYSLEQECLMAVKGGVSLLQYRNKRGSDDSVFRDMDEALAIRDICREGHVPFIVDDDVKLALELDADGVHIGQDDMNPLEARRILGEDRIIGVTAHNLSEALQAEKDGADYLGCGALFPTGSKKTTSPLSLGELKRIASSVKIPVVAIGGISSENVLKLKNTGIAGVASISGIFGNSNIEQETYEFVKLLKEVTG